jgi:hypothetical protein
MSYNYRLTYKLRKHPKGIAKEKIPNGFGGCDAVLFCSMLYPPDGSFSVYFIGVDGRKDDGKDFENLEDIEWFKVWTLLAARLGNSKTLEKNRRDFCRMTFESMRAKILGFSLN